MDAARDAVDAEYVRLYVGAELTQAVRRVRAEALTAPIGLGSCRRPIASSARSSVHDMQTTTTRLDVRFQLVHIGRFWEWEHVGCSRAGFFR